MFLIPISLGFFGSTIFAGFMLYCFFKALHAKFSKKDTSTNITPKKGVSKSKSDNGFTLYQIDAFGVSVSINTPDLTLLKHICIMYKGDIFEYNGEPASAEPGITLPPGDTSHIYNSIDKLQNNMSVFTLKAEHTVIKIKAPKLSAVKHIYICNPEDTKILEYTCGKTGDNADIEYIVP